MSRMEIQSFCVYVRHWACMAESWVAYYGTSVCCV